MHRNRHLYELDQYQEKLRSGYKRLGLFLKNEKDNKIFIFRPVPSCPWIDEGRKKYFRKLRSRLEILASSGKCSFATLTYSARFYTPESASARIKHDLDLFFKRLGYHHRKVQFFYVIELTDRLMPHIHIVFREFIPWQKLKSSWKEVTGNTVTNIKHKKNKDAFGYMLKYLTDSKKQSDKKWAFIFKNIDRIWTCSRGFMPAYSPGKKMFQFLFSLWDPNFITGPSFNDHLNDLISNEVNENDAIIISGFTDKFKGCKVLHCDDTWLLYNEGSNFDFNTLLTDKPNIQSCLSF